MADFNEVLQGIAQRAQQRDLTGEWPAEDLAALETVSAMRWAVPSRLGGLDFSALELHLKYEAIAAASLATALILTQRDSAVGLITAADGATKRRVLIERLAVNKDFATVGIAQLTTSKQEGEPALKAVPKGEGFEVNGLIPWCTGADMAQQIVAGAVLPDGNHILFLLDPHTPNVVVEKPMSLVALGSTHTSSLTLRAVRVDEKTLLAGPAKSVLAGRHGALALGQTFLATGLCRGILNLILQHDSARAKAVHAKLDQKLKALRDEVILLSNGKEAEASANNARIRAACNDLVLRASQIAVTLYKGTALLSDHPAQRFAREALFLLVWSCPNTVIDCTVDLLSAP